MLDRIERTESIANFIDSNRKKYNLKNKVYLDKYGIKLIEFINGDRKSIPLNAVLDFISEIESKLGKYEYLLFLLEEVRPLNLPRKVVDDLIKNNDYNNMLLTIINTVANYNCPVNSKKLLSKVLTIEDNWESIINSTE